MTLALAIESTSMAYSATRLTHKMDTVIRTLLRAHRLLDHMGEIRAPVKIHRWALVTETTG